MKSDRLTPGTSVLRHLPFLLVVLLGSPYGCSTGGSGEVQPQAPLSPYNADFQRVGGSIEPIVLSLWRGAEGDVWLSGGGRGELGGFVARLVDDVLSYEPVEYGRTIWWVWGADGAAQYACGEGGRILARTDDGWRLVYRFQDPKAVFWGGWTATNGETWVVGGSHGLRGPKGILIKRTMEGVWAPVETRSLEVTGNLFKAWGRSASEVYFVGEGGVALRWNGRALSRLHTPTEDLLFTIHGTPTGDIFAVGGATQGLALRLEGDRFVDDMAPAGQPPLNGVFATGAGQAVAVGARGSVLVRSAATGWSRRRDQQLRGLDNYTLHAVNVSTDIWAVGGDFSAGRDGIILQNGVLPVSANLPAINEILPAFDAGAPAVDGRSDAGVDAVMDGGQDSGSPRDAARDATADGGLDAQPDVEAPASGDSGSPPPPDGAVPDIQVLDAMPRVDVVIDRCGDGARTGEEACDDGNQVAGDGCSPFCQLECGDGDVGGDEECDDGDRVNGDGCDEGCLLECGNGRTDGAEECDDGGRQDGDGCDARCRLECGDGAVGQGEACDDGGREDGDGCSAECRIEPAAAGDACAERDCLPELECLGVAVDDFFPVCTGLCFDDDDCRELGFVEAVRCALIGPQLIDTYCVPERCYQDGCSQN